MPNQKGSLLDRLRSWNLFLKYKIRMMKKKREDKKRKKRLERELKKDIQISASGKYYSTPKVVGLTVAGLFLGVFENKTDKQKQIVEVEGQIETLESQIDNLSLQEKLDLTNTIEVKIVNLKFKNQFNNDIKSRVKTCESKLETIKQTRSYNSESKKDSEKQKSIKQVSFSKGKKGIYTPTLEIKVLNKQVKEYQKKLKEIDSTIKSTTDYNSLYELEFALKQIKLRLNDLLVRYENLRELPGFHNLENIIDIETIDIFNLRFNGNKINEQIKTCSLYLDNIEKTRKSLLNKTESSEKSSDQKKTEVKKKEKEEKKQKKEEQKIDNKILEIQLANKMVLDRIANERKNVTKFQRSISKMGIKQKRKSIFYYTKNILSSIINFGLSLFPLSLFKNKFIGGLTSGIMINNSLKSVRRVLNPEVDTIYILFSDFEKELNQTSDYLSSIDYVCNDSLKQINEIRNSIYMQYGSDLEYGGLLGDYLKDLDNVEFQVLKQQQAIMDLQQQVHITKVKNKQKIKEFKSY